ncbi:MAG: hypothetical protein WCF01_07395 [Nitrososphaeraceae archaeon]
MVPSFSVITGRAPKQNGKHVSMYGCSLLSNSQSYFSTAELASLAISFGEIGLFHQLAARKYVQGRL